MPVGARIAIYDSPAVAPRVEDVLSPDAGSAIEELAARAYHVAREMGGPIPYVLVREIVENLVHARFTEVVVTVLDDGHTIRFSDQGPGIVDKERAFLPGFSTATADMKRLIKGVGSGLPIVRECLSFSGGTVTIEDNLAGGTVVTLAAPSSDPDPVPRAAEAATPSGVPLPRLSMRQKRVLSLVMELGEIGPSHVSSELGVSVSTAHRDLAALQEVGLVVAESAGKRRVTDAGEAYLEALFRS